MDDLNNQIVGIKDLREILERQGCRCALTGKLLTPDNCALDHIIPLSRGGAHTKDNAQFVTIDVNRAKGMFLDEEFIQLCRDVIAYADRENK